MSTVLVIGAGGFVGSAVTRHLVNSIQGGTARFWDGEPISSVCAVLRPGSSAERLETVADAPSLRMDRANLTDIEEFSVLLDRQMPKAIVNAAFDATGFRPLSDADWIARHLEPIRAAFKVLAGRDGRLIHTGSAWVLATGDGLSEDAPTDPVLAYAKAKLRLDGALRELNAEFGVPYINLRLFNLFGRYEDESRLLPHLVESVRRGAKSELTHGDQVRDFNDIDDVAEVYGLALAAPQDRCGHIYHIGSGQGTRVRDFAEITCRALERPYEIRYNAARTRDQNIACLVSDPTLAMDRLGWRPNRDLEGRIHSAVEWWLARPALQTATAT